MKILIVEDDITIIKTLQLLLSSYNYAVDIALDGDAGLQMAEAYEYDLFLLDVILPKLDGVSLCKRLRANGCQGPILLLTGHGGAREKAIALNAGADDYVVKPFDPEELIARVQALLRRSGPINQSILSWGQLSVDPVTRAVAYATRLVVVSPKEYAILEFLLRKPQQALSASAILDHVWTSLEAPGEDVVRSHIKELRRKLAAAGAPKDFIKTVYKLGYRLNPLYNAPPISRLKEQLTPPQVAELNAVNEELRLTLEKLRLTQAELQQKHQELEAAYQTITQERQQLQLARNELERRVAERTAALMGANYALQQRQEQWQALFDHALDAIVIIDDQRCYVDLNPAACDLLGVSKAEILGNKIVQFSVSGATLDDVWKVLRAQGQVFGEYRIHRPDGSIREVEINAIADFVPGRHLAIMRDISERKLREIERHQATLALRESERKLTTVINNLPGYVYRVANDLNYTPEFISEGVVNITGYHQADYLIYRTTACGQQIYPEDVERVWDLIQQAVDNHQPYECEYRIITRTGALKWVWARGQGIYDDRGNLLYLEGFVTDITDRKQLELSLQASDTDTCGVAHALNNVFTPILAITKLLRLQQPDLDSSWQEMLTVIEDSAQRGATIVQQMLGVTQKDQVTLPIVAATPSHPQSLLPVAQGQEAWVLVVDDDPDVRLTTQTLLEHYHYHVLVTDNGSDAIALYTQQQAIVGLIILDIKMPDMDGMSLIKKLRGVNSNAEIIAISGLAANRDSALAAGARVFLAKPYTLDKLLAAVQSLLPI